MVDSVVDSVADSAVDSAVDSVVDLAVDWVEACSLFAVQLERQDGLLLDLEDLVAV